MYCMVSVAVIWTNRILPNLDNTLLNMNKRQTRQGHHITKTTVTHTKWPTYALTNFMCNMKEQSWRKWDACCFSYQCLDLICYSVLNKDGFWKMITLFKTYPWHASHYCQNLTLYHLLHSKQFHPDPDSIDRAKSTVI